MSTGRPSPLRWLSLPVLLLLGVALLAFRAPVPTHASGPSAIKNGLASRWAVCPTGMSLVAPPGSSAAGGFCIDRWEASVRQGSGGGAGVAESRPGVLPTTSISETDADQACRAAGKRLCSPEEWVAACTGFGERTWPYGTEEQPGRCNAERRATHPLTELYGAGREPFGDPEAMNDPRLLRLPDTVVPTGSDSSCVTPEGIYDLVGNVHEWTRSSPAGADSAGLALGEFHGGYFMDVHRNGAGCAYRTTAHAASYRDYSTGFRCCADGGLQTAAAPVH